MKVSLQNNMSKVFKIGDKVAVLDELINGVVHEVKGNNIIIKDLDGFFLTYKSSELIVIDKDQKEFSKFINIKQEYLLEKDEFEKRKKPKKLINNRKQPPLEVDLHIQHLTNSIKGMTNYEILTLQLETAKRRLAFAKEKKIQRIIFIHGVGEGVLEAELKNLLKDYPVEIYPASFQKYGFGATEVYLYQNPI